MFKSSQLERGARRLPLELRYEIAKLHVAWRKKRIRNRTARFIWSEMYDGYPSSVVLSIRDDVLEWIAVVERYYAHRTPRCRPDLSLQNLDNNTLFWVQHSPFRHLHILDITLTSSVIGADLTVSEAGNLGRHLAWVPLQHLTLRASAVDPLFNGIVQWPQLPGIKEVVLYFTRRGPPNEWKQPFFPHALRAFPNLQSLHLHVERLGTSRSPLLNPHPLFASYAKGVPYVPRQTGETSAMTVRRVAANICYVCTSLERIAWNERRRDGRGWHTEALAYRRDSVTQVWQ